MNGDLMPSGGHRRKADPAYAKKIIAGGRLAREIEKKTRDDHARKDVPLAEVELQKDLESLNNDHLKHSKK